MQRYLKQRNRPCNALPVFFFSQKTVLGCQVGSPSSCHPQKGKKVKIGRKKKRCHELHEYLSVARESIGCPERGEIEVNRMNHEYIFDEHLHVAPEAQREQAPIRDDVHVRGWHVRQLYELYDLYYLYLHDL